MGLGCWFKRTFRRCGPAATHEISFSERKIASTDAIEYAVVFMVGHTLLH
jgi:hypothetical protein